MNGLTAIFITLNIWYSLSLFTLGRLGEAGNPSGQDGASESPLPVWIKPQIILSEWQPNRGQTKQQRLMLQTYVCLPLSSTFSGSETYLHCSRYNMKDTVCTATLSKANKLLKYSCVFICMGWWNHKSNMQVLCYLLVPNFTAKVSPEHGHAIYTQQIWCLH